MSDISKERTKKSHSMCDGPSLSNRVMTLLVSPSNSLSLWKVPWAHVKSRSQRLHNCRRWVNEGGKLVQLHPGLGVTFEELTTRVAIEWYRSLDVVQIGVLELRLCWLQNYPTMDHFRELTCAWYHRWRTRSCLDSPTPNSPQNILPASIAALAIVSALPFLGKTQLLGA